MNLRIILFGLLILAQIAVPLRMIQQRETVLREGALFRFKTQPIDPADPFQGRYVWLRIKEDYVRLSEVETEAVDYNTRGYATVSIDEHGFAFFDSWSTERPTTGGYLKTRALGQQIEWETLFENERSRMHKGLRIDIPFTRYYMDEAKAPRAEITRPRCLTRRHLLGGRAHTQRPSRDRRRDDRRPVDTGSVGSRIRLTSTKQSSRPNHPRLRPPIQNAPPADRAPTAYAPSCAACRFPCRE